MPAVRVVPAGGTRTIHIEQAAHEELERLAARRRSTVTEAVARAVRLLRQDVIGQQLGVRLEDDERAWLDAALG